MTALDVAAVEAFERELIGAAAEVCVALGVPASPADPEIHALIAYERDRFADALARERDGGTKARFARAGREKSSRRVRSGTGSNQRQIERAAPLIKPNMSPEEIRQAWAEADAQVRTLGLPPIATLYAELKTWAQREGIDLPRTPEGLP